MRTVGQSFKEAKNAEKITPIFLYSLRFDIPTNSFKRWTSFPGGVNFNGIKYDHFPAEHNVISENSSGAIQKARLRLLNISREIQLLIDDHDGLRDRQLTITQVFKEFLTDPTAFIQDQFTIKETSVSEREALLSLSSELDVLDIRLPRRSFTRTFCRFKFKSLECGYTEEELLCDKTFTRCRELDNAERYGGFPATPLQLTFRQPEKDL